MTPLWWRARLPGRRAVIAVALLAAAAVAAVVIATMGGGHVTRPVAGRRAGRHGGTGVSSLPHPGFTPVAPATISPSDGPVQQQYDQWFGRAFGSPTGRRATARYKAVPVPPPGTGGGWPALPAASDPETWAREFTAGLLDISFARQSRVGLARWLAAQSAPEILPGAPVMRPGRTLVAGLLDPSVTGVPSPIPSQATWQADAARRGRWQVTDLHVQVDPSWQQMIDAGWQPEDLRSVAEDVSGTLTVTVGKTTTRHVINLVMLLGSAAWHGGYGTVNVTEAKGQ